jgi:glucosamine 6-phosphate synthetase-like amidotransferase/phosphosugar isomerase protein
MISQVEQVKARGGLVLAVAEMAVRRGADVDQPRNLAKSVTVE